MVRMSLEARAARRARRPAHLLAGLAILALAVLALAGAGAPATAAEPAGAAVVSQATGSAFFSLGAPSVNPVRDGVRLAGRICRLRRSTLLTPQEIRIEHVGADGRLLDTVDASTPIIGPSWDQACRTYSRRVPWTLSQGEMVVACFEHGRRCPVEAQTRPTAPEPRRARSAGDAAPAGDAPAASGGVQ